MVDLTRFCLLTAFTPNWGIWTDYATKKLQVLRDSLGCQLRIITDGFEEGIHPTWNKPKFILETLKQADYVWWMDGDIILTRWPTKDNLDEWFFSKNKDVVMCYDPPVGSKEQYSKFGGAVQAGCFFCKNTSATIDLLNFVHERRYETRNLWDQDAFSEAVFTKGFNKITYLYEFPQLFNVFCNGWTTDHYVIHLANARNDKPIAFYWNILPRLIKTENNAILPFQFPLGNYQLFVGNRPFVLTFKPNHEIISRFVNMYITDCGFLHLYVRNIARAVFEYDGSSFILRHQRVGSNYIVGLEK